MKIAIVGAGIIGVTTAWELAADGHEVQVFDRRSAAAEAASFANAGVVAPGYVTPWAAPGMQRKVLQSLLSHHGAIKLRWPLNSTHLRWVLQWRRACKLENYLANRARLQRLAFYSKARLHGLVAQQSLSYERSDGYLVLLRDKREQAMVQPGLEVLRQAGTVFREIDAAAVRQLEPALSQDTELLGAIHLPDDEIGNCRQFALLIKREAEALGVRFFFDSHIARLSAADPRALQLVNGQQSVRYDAIVVCAGAESPQLLSAIGVHVPVVPVYGYSVSANIREPLNAPRSAVMDERYKVAISRLGMRVRVAGSAELGGKAHVLHPGAIQTLYKVLHDWFPGGAQLDSGVQHWKGARPMLPDGPPLIGPSGVPGVWLNLGHGSSGWALSCGSARVLADQLSGRPSEIDLEGLGLERYRRT